MALVPSPQGKLWAAVKSALVRAANRLRVRLNQYCVCRRARQTGELHLVPVNPWRGCGSTEHYYHFIVDLLLPLHCVLRHSPPGINLVIEPWGPFHARLGEIFELQVGPAREAEQKPLPLIGMNPRHVHVTRREVESFRASVLQVFGKSPVAALCTRVILIERGAPEEYFLSEASKGGGGAARRSIRNHGQFLSLLKRTARPGCEIINVRLERLSQAEQVHLFHSAAVVIGQHGAGLVNTLWMNPGGCVIELTHEPHKDHFSRLSQLCGHTHLTYEVAESHPEIHLAACREWLASCPELDIYFGAA